MATIKKSKNGASKGKTLIASGDIWEDAGISASSGMKDELKKLGITPTRLIKTTSSGISGSSSKFGPVKLK